MPRARKVLVALLTFFVLGFVSVSSAQADPITVSLVNQNNLGTVPGAAITLIGTLTNNSSSVLYINSSGGAVNINVPPNSNIVLDATFHIRPDSSTYILQPGQTTNLIPFVTLFINRNAPDPSITSGFIEICGGSSPTACNHLSKVNYSIRVSAQPVPEPATIFLAGTGLAGLIVAARKRRAAGG